MNASPTSSPPSGSLASRAAVSTVVIALFATLCWADATGLGGVRAGWWLLPVALGIAAGAAAEATGMAERSGLALSQPLVAVATALLPLVALVAGPTSSPAAVIGQVGLTLTLVLGLLFVVEIAQYRPAGQALPRIAASLLTIAAVGLPLAFMVDLRSRGGGLAGLLPLISMVAVVKGGDIAAYLVGSRFGRRRMAPVVSPGKTWEGAAASVAASLAVAWLLLEGSGWTEAVPLGGWPVYGLAVGVAGMLGDLSESLVKRELGMKDSGRALGGLGGFLDLVDAVLFATPVAWLLWTLGGQP